MNLSEITEIEAETVLPATTARVSGFDWDLTHYVNNVNTEYTQVLAEYGPSGTLTADYTYGLGLVDIRASGASPTTDWLTSGSAATGWYLPDGRGSLTGVTDATGSLVQSTTFDPWGVPTQTTGATSSTVFGWNQEEYSPVTGLQYLRARWYEPTTSRFASADTWFGEASSPKSLNRYAYAWGDPLNMIDPSGHWPGFLDSALNWVNDHVVQPVVNAVTTAANYVYEHVVQPAWNWLNDNVFTPIGNFFSTAAETVSDVVSTVYDAAAGFASDVYDVASLAYRSTVEYVQARTAELKQAVIEFACTTAEKLSDAWQSAKQAVSSLPWGTIGQVALMIGGAALTVATLGAAGPVIGTIMVVGLVASTAVDVNEMVAEATGTNFIRDTLLGGNEGLYDGLSVAAGLLGLVGPGGAVKAASKLDDVVEAVDTVRDLGKAADAADTVKDTSKLDNVLDGKSSVSNKDATTPKADKDPAPASCPVGSYRSFTAQTLVVMGDGSLEPIGEVEVGDQVLSYDPGSDRRSVETVTAVWVHDDPVVSLTLDDGTVVETTVSHPWWVASERAYLRSDHLQAGDQLLVADGSTVTVTGLSGSSGRQPVFNLSVTGPHTFYVAEIGILVHNDGGLSASSTPDEVRAAVQAVVDDTVSQGREVLKTALSPDQVGAMTKKPYLADAFVGTAVHDGTVIALDVTYKGQFDYTNNNGVDFTHKPTGVKVEVTTEGQVGAHKSRGGDYLTCQYATYVVPK